MLLQNNNITKKNQINHKNNPRIYKYRFYNSHSMCISDHRNKQHTGYINTQPFH